MSPRTAGTDVRSEDAARADEVAPALSVRDLRKSYGSTVALDEVSLSVSEGEFVTLLGPSGSGKTTLLRLVAGFFPPDAGRIHIAGRDITYEAPHRRHIGYVFQNYALFPHLTVRENLAYGLKRKKRPRKEIAGRVAEVLGMMRLDTFAERMPRELSGGQQQRVAVGRALASRPALLLMDEPLAALDRSLRFELQEELRRLHREDGTTVIYVTHDQQEALALSDRVAIMRDGRFVRVAAPRALYAEPHDEFSARFLGDCNLFEPQRAEWRGDRVLVEWLGKDLEFTAPDSAPDRPARSLLGLRPGRLTIADGRQDLTVRGTIEDIAFLGEGDRLTIRLDGLGEAVSIVPAHRSRDLAIGDAVVCGIDVDDLFHVTAS